MFRQLGHDLVDDHIMRFVARMNDNVGRCIQRLTLRQQLPDLLDQRSIATALGPLNQHVRIGLQPHGNSLDMDEIARVLVHHRAAAGRQHLRAVVEQARDHAFLAGTEIRLAVFVENFGNSHARSAFDFSIGINEWNPEPGGKPSADRGFARAHHADEHNRPAAERADHYQAIFRWFLNGTVTMLWFRSESTVPYTSNRDTARAVLSAVPERGRNSPEIAS